MPIRESSYYPAVQSFLKRQGYICESLDRNRRPIPFITRGIRQVIMDVFGLRAVRSRYSTDLEVAAVEVKRGKDRASLRNMHQALNNKRIAHYCYLASPRNYSEKERTTAAELGIGLLRIKNTKRVELVSLSSRFQPSASMLREFLRKNLKIAQCAICGNYTSLFDIPEGQNREGGGWRDNVFASPEKPRWTYFCKQCRERFENVFSERRMIEMQRNIARLAEHQKRLRAEVRKLRKSVRKRRRK